MFNIDEKEILRFSESSAYVKIAESLRMKDAVELLEIKVAEPHSKFSIDYVVKAIINDNQEFEFNMRLNSIGKVVNYYSSSYVFNPEKAYVLLILLIIKDENPSKFPFILQTKRHLEKLENKRKKDAEAVAGIINMYREKSKKEISENIISGVHCLNVDLKEDSGKFKLKFKVGTYHGTKYIVKNLQNFILDTSRSSFVEYGKLLSFKQDERNFDEPTQKMIAFISKVLTAQTASNSQVSIKELELTNRVIDDFYHVFVEIPSEYFNFSLDDAVDAPIFHIEKTENFYIITLKTKYRYVLGQNHLYHFDQGSKILYRTKLDDAGKTIGLIYRISKQKELVVRIADFDDFYNYVLYDIKQHVQITGLDFISKHEDEISVYTDVDDDDRTYVMIEYLYDNGVKIQGFDEKNKNLSVNALKVESYIRNFGVFFKERKIVLLSGEEFNGVSFINEGLGYLEQYASIYVSESLNQVRIKRPIQMRAGVTIRNDLLSIDLDSVDIPRDELAAVLSSYRRKKKFHKLKSGERLYIDSDELNEVDQMLVRYNIDPTKIKDGHLDLDLFRVFSVNAHAEDDNSLIEFERSEIYSDFIKNFSEIKPDQYNLTSNYSNLLRDYQKYGFQWLSVLSDYGFSGILADDMGLGKTLQVIALLDHRVTEAKKSIVIAPASLILNWEDEVKKFAKDLKALSVYGSAATRRRLIKNSDDYDLLITSYDYIRRDIDAYSGTTFEYIVIDEAQYIKNHTTKSAKAVKELKAKNRIALTGTPIENSLAEMWSIFDFLMPGYLFPYAYFAKEYERPIVRDQNLTKQNELKKLISPFILRRRKQEVLKELPDKIESTLTIEFTEEEKKLYLANLSQVNMELQDKLQMDQANAIAILAMLTRLRQICCEPRVLYENIQTRSSKIEACMELILRLRENGKKILLFSSFTSVLDLIREALNSEKISHYILTGSTDKTKRRELVAKFQEDDTAVFLISLKAGGTGLNLTAAEAVIHFDPWWNMSAQNQATDRAHRIGQVNTVQVFKLIMKDSIEEKIQKLQESKKDLADAFVEGNDGRITNMSREEIMDLFKHS